MKLLGNKNVREFRYPLRCFDIIVDLETNQDCIIILYRSQTPTLLFIVVQRNMCSLNLL